VFPDLVTEPAPKSQLAPLPEKVLSLGDIVSLTFRRFRLYYKLYFKALFWPAVFCSLASHLAYFCLRHWISIASTSMLAMAPFVLHMALALVSLIIWFFSAWELCLRSCALVRTVLCLDATYKDSLTLLKKRAGTVFFACNLALLPPALCLIFWSVVIVAAAASLNISLGGSERVAIGTLVFAFIGFALTVSVMISGLFGSLLLAVVTLEQISFVESFKRTWFFVSMRMMRGGSFTSLLAVAIALVCVVIESPMIILQVIEQTSHATFKLSQTPYLVDILETILEVPFNIFTFSISFTAYGLFYRDLRLRLEGADLLARLARLAKSNETKAEEI
jgi:hypothetical protein